jgi:hypothetical protein
LKIISTAIQAKYCFWLERTNDSSDKLLTSCVVQKSLSNESQPLASKLVDSVGESFLLSVGPIRYTFNNKNPKRAQDRQPCFQKLKQASNSWILDPIKRSRDA